MLEECTVDQIIALFEYRAPVVEEKKDDDQPVRVQVTRPQQNEQNIHHRVRIQMKHILEFVLV